MIPAYYNEHDEYPAQWLRNLIAAGHIPAGDVDTRSIADVQPDDLTAYGQCHFFAGIGGWALAARIAGWPDDRPLWSGSLPCQPYSFAGAQLGNDDERDLWHHQRRLIHAGRPLVFMGEQVAAAISKHWLDRLFTDLQEEGYTSRSAVIPACAVNAPHRRDRIFVIADLGGGALDHGDDSGLEGFLDDDRSQSEREGAHRPAAEADSGGLLGDTAGVGGFERLGSAGVFAQEAGEGSAPDAGGRGAAGGLSALAWAGAGYIIGHDGKARRVEPGLRLLAHGVSARVGKLRAYGNAIVPQVAAEVIGAYMDCRP